MSENTQDSAWPPCETTLFSVSVNCGQKQSIEFDVWHKQQLTRQANCSGSLRSSKLSFIFPSSCIWEKQEKENPSDQNVKIVVRIKTNIGWGKLSWYTNKFSQNQIEKKRKLRRRINILTKDWNSYVASKQFTCFSSHFVCLFVCLFYVWPVLVMEDTSARRWWHFLSKSRDHILRSTS